jgi:hypothetical protein
MAFICVFKSPDPRSILVNKSPIDLLTSVFKTPRFFDYCTQFTHKIICMTYLCHPRQTAFAVTRTMNSLE